MDDKAVNFTRQGDVTIAALQTAELTPQAEQMLEEKFQELLSSGQAPRFVLDLTRIRFLGSVGLGLLVTFLGRVRKNGGQLALAGLSGQSRGVMQVCGLERAFLVCQDIPGAVKALETVAPAANPL